MRVSLFIVATAILMVFCFDNKQFVNINLGLNSLGFRSALTIELPIFMVVLFAVAFGFFLGSILEFFRQKKHIFENRKFLKNLKADSEELKRLKRQKQDQKEEILSLLE